MLSSYLLVRWVPRPNVQLPLQVKAVPSEWTQERAGLAPTHLPRLQRYSRDKTHRDAASDHRGL